MNKIIKLSIFLALVAMVSAIFVGLVNNFTSPIIAENLIKSERTNLELLYPGADFKAIENFTDETNQIQGIYSVNDESYVVKLEGKGYSANGFIYLLALNKDLKVDGLVVLSHSETSGIGSKAFEDDYINKLKEGSSDTISGATFTSSAIQRGIEAAKTALGAL